MAQLTLRAPDDLVHRVRVAATTRGLSINEYAVRVLSAATDPELAGSEVERLRERLASAGLLELPRRRQRPRPSREQVAAARAVAGRGQSLSSLVERERG